MSSGKTIALVYDLDQWVLGFIARSMKRYVEPHAGIEYRLHSAPATTVEFNELQKNADVIHFLSPWLFFQYHSLTRRPAVVTVHHLTDETVKNLRSTAHHIDALCYTNHQCHLMLLKLGCIENSRMFSTPYGLETELFKPDSAGRHKIAELFSFPPDCIVIGFSAKKTSNESSRKGVERYYGLMEMLIAQYGDKVRLIVFGPGPESPYGWSIDDFPPSIRAHVHLPGYLPYDQLPGYYSGLDCYVCLSSIEGGPYPVMECMACGVPVISTKVGVVEMLINDGDNGFIVTADDYLQKIPDVLALLRSETGYASMIGARARDAVVRSHSWEYAGLHANYDRIYQCSDVNWDRRPRMHKACKHILSLMKMYT